MEIWKDVVGYEGLYQVSNLGRVRGVDRFDAMGRKHDGIVLRQAYTRGNYLVVGLCKNGIKKLFRVNRLVAIAFIDNPNNYPQVGHLDDNKENNTVNNLYWTTSQENNTHNNKHIKIARKIKKAICGFRGSECCFFESSIDAGKHGFNSSAIRNCLTGRSSKHKGYAWQYVV